MTSSKLEFAKLPRTARSAAALSIPAILLMLIGSPNAQAQPTDDTPRIAQGLAIAPVPLKLTGLDKNLVGLGSYLVNAVGDCNGCHSAGPPTEWAKNSNPYFGQFAAANPATYLGGGRDFGPFPSADPPGAFPHIVSRNLTPNKTGLPAGGMTLQDFQTVLRTGRDFDHLHPTCLGAPDGKCIPGPFRGDLLQIMRCPAFQNISDHDIAAMYEYLKAIPCIAGPTDTTSILHNDCPPATPPPTASITIVVATLGGATDPNNTFTTTATLFTLDASQSKSTNGGTLTYSWAVAPSFPNVTIMGANTATPTFQLTFIRQAYQFTLTVTDSTGLTATTTVTIQYI